MSTRRTNSELADTDLVIARLLDLGASTSCCVAFLMSEYSISRSQAYKTVAHCNEARGREGLHPVEPPTFAVRDTCLRICMQSLLKAEVAGSVENVARLSKEIRSLLSLGGLQQRESLTSSVLLNQSFSSHIEDDPTTPPLTNDDPNTTTAEHEAVTSGDWKGYFDGWDD